MKNKVRRKTNGGLGREMVNFPHFESKIVCLSASETDGKGVVRMVHYTLSLECVVVIVIPWLTREGNGHAAKEAVPVTLSGICLPPTPPPPRNNSEICLLVEVHGPGGSYSRCLQ